MILIIYNFEVLNFFPRLPVHSHSLVCVFLFSFLFQFTTDGFHLHIGSISFDFLLSVLSLLSLFVARLLKNSKFHTKKYNLHFPRVSWWPLKSFQLHLLLFKQYCDGCMHKWLIWLCVVVAVVCRLAHRFLYGVSFFRTVHSFHECYFLLGHLIMHLLVLLANCWLAMCFVRLF